MPDFVALLQCFVLAYGLELLCAFYTIDVARGRAWRASAFSGMTGIAAVATTFYAVVQSHGAWWWSALAVGAGYALATRTAMWLSSRKGKIKWQAR